MHRRRRVGARVLTSALVLGAVAAPGADAHVTIQPTASQPAALQRYTVYVPNEETASTTTGVDLRLPPGITFALAEHVAGWRVQVVRAARGDAISELRWTRGRVPPDGYAELHFIARNPVKTGRVSWKALQRYADGTVVRWIGNPDSDTPAPVTTLSEHAVPVDVVSTNGERLPSAPAAAAVTSVAAADAGSGRDGLTLGLAIGGALLGAAALAVALSRRRAG
jgi:uncharacterized protein YcnI